MLYSCLKPRNGEAPFYVYLSLDDDTKRLVIYYYRAFHQTSTQATFDKFFQDFTAHRDSFVGSSGRKGFKRTTNTLSMKGKAMISSQILSDLIGFVERDTRKALPSKIRLKVSVPEKLVNVHLTIPYSALGGWPQEIRKLNIFSATEEDAEHVKPNLKFFQTTYFVTQKINLTN